MIQVYNIPVKWKPKTHDIPQGLMLGWVLFSTFLSDMDRGTESTPRKFADDTKLQGAANTPEVKDVVRRDLDRLERWVWVNIMKFNRAKCKVLPLGRGNPKHKHRLGGERTESSPEEKDL
ncbi:hypothetical protein DUI87_10824 [Hirundo rustica rustica]|uniref:Reverse transcriptase domain-containing protein n=1 Tax=Hirundo rustica rustica TaxID=333673 RepID=A0A3M0KJ60_HIRRU|nr:hypothetical protein DUI87_10824 [Hirundo rustica rustica]